MCPLKLRVSCICRPKYLTEEVLGISQSPILSLGKFVLCLSFLGEYIVYRLSLSLPTLTLSLFAMSQFEREWRSSLAFEFKGLRSL